MKLQFMFLVFSIAIVTLISNGISHVSTGNTMITKVITTSVNHAIAKDGVPPQEKDLGIGPVKNVVLGPLDDKMIADGKKIFNNKCTTCHEMDQKKIGPPLRNVTKERTPEFIMNLLVNTIQMQQENQSLIDLIQDYNNLPMPNPVLNQTQARLVLEYLRSVAKQ